MKKVVLVFIGGLCIVSAGILMGFMPQSTESESVTLRIGGVTLWANMDGAQETGPGDPDGSGYAELTLNSGQETIEYTLQVENIQAATAAHIHFAPAGVAGPVVVALSAPSSGMSSGVVMADRELIKAIRKNPSAYYVNVHNPTYPGGAVRGQLSK